MLADSGVLLTGLTLAASLYAVFATVRGIRDSDARWIASGRNGVYASVGLLGLAVVGLLAAFLTNQFQIKYVALNSSRALPSHLKLSALWAGQEGSLLLWSFLQALFGATILVRPSRQARPLVPWATVFLSVITAFFTGVTLFLNNPFVLLEGVPVDGQGLNPLLRHPGMIFHPPALYLGYVGLAVPFAFAMAALVTRQVEGWTAVARRWTLASWLFLGLGLLLGMRWAYDVLGWGGYWGWDPVENAGLLPWLTATALLHAAAMQDQRSSFRWWNVSMAVVSFILVLFGTFTTRSGMIQSVHAFARSVLGYYFLGFMLLTLVVSAVLMFRARRSLDSPRPLDGLISRDGMFVLTMILFSTITFTVLVGSLLPTLTEALAGQRYEAGPDWFDRVTGPQFALLLLVLGLCPLLGRAASALRQLGTRGWPALVAVALVTVGAVVSGFRDPLSLVGFALVGLAGGAAVTEIVRVALARSRRKEEAFLTALWTMMENNRRRYGGYLVHIGVILMALGIVGTRMYEFEAQVTPLYGESVDVGDYTLVYEGLDRESDVDRVTVKASVAAYRDGVYLSTLQPRKDLYVNSEQPVTTPALLPGLREDLYIVLAGWEDDGALATFAVYVNALVSFLWIGTLVFLAGGTLAVWPSATAKHLSERQIQWRKTWNGVGLAVGSILLVLAAWAMWGPGHGAVAQPAGRPLPGQNAPNFTLELIDGEQFSMSESRGQIVVINFWATWCPSCVDEMPDLQAVWEDYRDDGVVVIGVAYQDREEDVRELADSLGITYPLGLDVEDRIYTSYGATGVPETFVVDAEGKASTFFIGQISAEQLRAELDRLLGR